MSDPTHDMEGRRASRRPFAWLRAFLGLFTFWRIFAVVVLLLIIGAMRDDAAPSGPYVARLWIDGLIVDDAGRDALIADLRDDDDVKAVILRINSPGGTTAGSEALYISLRDLAAAKPVVAALGSVAASGGYIAAIGADWIVARGNTMTASIGVVMQYPQLTGLLDRLGIEMKEIKSSPLKASPSPFVEAPAAAIAVQREMVADSYAWFRGLVAERRGLEGAALDAVADGRVVSGRMALDAGLVDVIGGEPQAVAWLRAEHGVTAAPRDAEIEEARQKRLIDLVFSQLGVEVPTFLLREAAGRALSGPRLMSVLD